jgi:hypothetical protein
MSEPKPTPRLPAIGEHIRSYGTLVEVQDVTPPAPAKVEDWIFASTSAKVVARINGNIVREYETFNDHYGMDTAVEYAIESAKAKIEHFGPSDLEFIVVKITELSRMRPTADEAFYDREFREFKHLDHARCWGLGRDKEEIVWSSKEANS